MLHFKRDILPYFVCSNMNILAEGINALIIDPHYSADADSFLKQSYIDKVTFLFISRAF